MILPRLLAATLATAALGSAKRPHLVPRFEAVEALQPPTPDIVTDNYAVLTRGPGKTKSSSYLHGLLQGNGRTKSGGRHHDKPIGLAKLFQITGETLFANVTVDGQEFSVYVDTGSDLLWVPLANITCLDNNKTVVDHDAVDCGFGNGYKGNPSGGVIPNDYFSIIYGDGTYANGTTGLVDFTVANITVKNQYIALANQTYWNVDNISSGLMGLSYPNVKRTPHGLKAHEDRNNTLLTNMIKNDARLTSFSISTTSRSNASEGYLAFGGLPPVPVVPPFASVPMQTMSIYNASRESYWSYDFFFYNVIPDAYVYDGYHRPTYNGSLYNYTRGPEGKEAAAILDTGTLASYLPEEVVKNVSRLYDPPAISSKDDEYFVLCNATAPKFGVKMGGETLWISEENMVLQDYPFSWNFTTMEPYYDNSTSKKEPQYCVLGIQPQSFDPEGTAYLLGSTFLNNVLSVFDIGAGEVRFANLAH